jgi:hypothetical protein
MVPEEQLTLSIHPLINAEPGLVPIARGKATRAWWEEDVKTVDHARFCLPLLMANQLGFELLSPIDVVVEWSGKDEPKITVNDGDHRAITTHSAEGSFTIQLNLVFRTPENWFTLVKGMPNVRRPFNVMEGLIETWWTPANFGVICLMHGPDIVRIRRGEPLAVAVPIHADTLKFKPVQGCAGEHLPHRVAFEGKRRQLGKTLDYLKGLTPGGERVCPHYRPGQAPD